MSPAPRLLARISLVIALLAASPLRAATLFDPALRFRTIGTEHFIIYFHQGEDALASRLAVIAEEAWARLRQPLGVPTQKRTHVVLVDQSELSNGSAFPIPYDSIVVTAAWPAGSEFIGNTDDWLRLVFTHEFAHIVHLDQSGGWAKLVRRTFGRTPLAFPNLFLPIWQIEGLAVFEESQLAGEGRLHAGDFRAIEREAARAHALPPIDRVNGGLTSWPDGLAPYAYGLGFHAYLADQYGPERIAALTMSTARRLPFFVGSGYRSVYGRSLDALWKDYEAHLTTSVDRALPPSDATQLTHHGFTVIGPRFSAPAEIVYAVRTPHRFPTLNAISTDGSNERRLATRYLGSTSGVGEHVIVFDQQDLHRNAGLYGDLYLLDRQSGAVRRLTSQARLLDPDLSPDERSIVCVREGRGRRELVLVRLTASAKATAVRRSFMRRRKADATGVGEIVTLISEPETQFNAPRWSPDGRRIAVERHALGRNPEIVIVDSVTKAVRVVASQHGTRVATPAWRPDGRAIVAAAAPDDETFDLYEFDLQASGTSVAPRRLTHTTGGATWPDVSRDGSRLAFVGYTVNGFELFTMPYPVGSSSVGPVFRRGVDTQQLQDDRRDSARAARLRQGFGASAEARELSSERRRKAWAYISSSSTAYKPLKTLLPTSWSPVVEATDDDVRLGVATAARDVLGYHAFGAAATWPVSGRTPASATPDWQVAYAYDRWQPTLFASASQEVFGSDQLEAGALWPIRTVRVSNHAFASAWRSVDATVRLRDGVPLNRTASRFGWTTSNAREFGFSVSPERGVSAGVTAEMIRTALGSSGEATTATADFRSYIPTPLAHHVLAVRAGGGISNGDAEVQRIFSLGGAASNLSLLDFGGSAFSLLRGFHQDTVQGTRIAVVNADYRWPLARPQRGVSTLPLFLHTVHAAVFADAGHAWNGRLRARDIQTSAGGELSIDVVVGYSVRLAVTAGAAWTRDGSRDVTSGPAFFARVGRAF